VLVTVSSPEDLSRLKEVVDRVIPQETNGKSTVQVGVFSSQDNAARLVEILAGKGFQAVVVPDVVRS
jgi:cell division septation protein DedD